MPFLPLEFFFQPRIDLGLCVGLCLLFPIQGGLKAVVWTDVFQVGIMVAGFSAVIIRAVVVKGGIGPILNDSYHGGRLNFWK